MPSENDSPQAQPQEAELKPCPFCGGSATPPVNAAKGRPVWEIACSLYCVSLLRSTKSEAVKHWNTRADLPRATVDDSALQDLFDLFERDTQGRWCFKSLGADASKLDKIMDRLAAPPSKTALTVESWQPIETAPKDGQSILVFDGGDIVTVKWRYDERWGGVWGSEDYIQDGSIFDEPLIAHNPTLWQPLPPPPRAWAKSQGRVS